MKAVLYSTSTKEFHDMKESKSYANAIAAMANMEIRWCVVA